MAYRPQFAYPPPPLGWKDEEFEYYWDGVTIPVLLQAPVNQVPLPMQADAEYRIRAFEMSGDTGMLAVRFYTARSEPLSFVPVENDLAYSGVVQGSNPVGRLPVPLNDEIVCPPGAALFVDLQLIPS